MNEDIEFIKKTLKSAEAREIRQKSFEENKKVLESMEENRYKNSKMSKDYFSRYSQARNLVDSAIPHLVVFMKTNGISADQLFSQNEKEKIELFNKHLNSVNVLSMLVLERDFTAEKTISANDAYDMAHLSGAIPYCDVVVTDKMFARISTHKKLDKIYDCVILDDLISLAQIEPIKSKIQKLEII